MAPRDERSCLIYIYDRDTDTSMSTDSLSSPSISPTHEPIGFLAGNFIDVRITLRSTTLLNSRASLFYDISSSMSLSTWSAATTPFNSVTSLIRHDGLKELDIPYHVLETIHYAHLEVDASGVVSLPSNSPAHPRRWPLSRRLYDTALICLVEFFTTVISNSGSSVVDAATPVLGVSRLSTICCFTTVYLLGQGFGGLILPPITESFGSKYVYVGSTLGYALMCLIIGLAPSLASVIVCRLVSGILSAMPTVVAVGSIENNWNASERVWMIYMWSFFGTMALSIGPVYATFITESSLGWYVSTTSWYQSDTPS